MKKLIVGMLLAFSLVSVASASNVQKKEITYSNQEVQEFPYLYKYNTHECQLTDKWSRDILIGYKAIIVKTNNKHINKMLNVVFNKTKYITFFENESACNYFKSFLKYNKLKKKKLH